MQEPRTDCTRPGELAFPAPTSVCLWHSKVSCLAFDPTDEQGAQEGSLCT